MNFYRFFSYLRYFIHSRHRNGHGIHSPFIYDIVSRIFRNKIDSVIVNRIEAVRKRLLSDRREIRVLDLGSGSAIIRNKNGNRKVSSIARYSSVPEKYGILMANMASEFGKPYMIELGTSLGLSSMYIAGLCPETLIHTIEGCPETAGIARENFEKEGLKNIKLHIGSFDERLTDILRGEETPPGLVFIDGDHRKESLLRYFGLIAESSGNNTVVIIDDISLSSEMNSAWQEIKSRTGVSVTIDINRMGFVFFRKGINRNHFVVRY